MHPYTLVTGAAAPDFSLIGTDGKTYTLENFEKARLLVVFFTCNHCPYVLNSETVIAKTAERFARDNVAFVAINSNSSDIYKEDSYDNMILRMKKNKFPWVYLWDEKQTTATNYGALRTPHFFVFDEKRRLIYTGRGLDNPKEPAKALTNDLEKALEEYLSGRHITNPRTNPIGCNVKWKGKPAHWMPPEACDLV